MSSLGEQMGRLLNNQPCDWCGEELPSVRERPDIQADAPACLPPSLCDYCAHTAYTPPKPVQYTGNPPVCEMFNEKEFKRLEFIRWLVSTGAFDDDISLAGVA